MELNSLNAMLTTSVTVNRNNDESNNEVLDQTAEANNSLLQCSTPSKPSVSFSISPPQKTVHNSSSKGSFYSESTDQFFKFPNPQVSNKAPFLLFELSDQL